MTRGLLGHGMWWNAACACVLASSACGGDPTDQASQPGETRDGSSPDAPPEEPEEPLIVDGLTRLSLGDRERFAFDGFHWSTPEEQRGAAAVRLDPLEYPFEVRKVVYDLVDGDYVDSKGVDCDPAFPHSLGVGLTAGTTPPATFDQTYEVSLAELSPAVEAEPVTLEDRNEKRDIQGTRFVVTLSEPLVIEEGQSLVIALFLGVGDLVSSCPMWDYGDETTRDRNYINASDPVEWVTKIAYDDAHFLPGSDKDLTFEMLGTAP